jgi:3-dehydroquinate dehydratase-1
MSRVAASRLGSPLVVGTIHSPGALKKALKLKRGDVDVLELRVDAFVDAPEKLLRAVPGLAAPLLLTVRHPKEGGMAQYGLTERRHLVRQFLPLVQWVDVEVRSLDLLEAEIAHAVSMGVRLVVSHHEFKTTPSLDQMEAKAALAKKAGAEVFKLAATVKTPVELERLFGFLNRGKIGTRAVMGMGELGQVSRLLFGRCGSVLNYGYLDQPQVPGQWEACLLKQRLAELFGALPTEKRVKK